MPLFRRSSSGPGGGGITRQGGGPNGASSAAAVPRFLTVRRGQTGAPSQTAAVGFKAPTAATDIASGGGAQESPASATVTCRTSSGGRREIVYPSAPSSGNEKGGAVSAARASLLARRMARRCDIDYHQPASAGVAAMRANDSGSGGGAEDGSQPALERDGVVAKAARVEVVGADGQLSVTAEVALATADGSAAAGQQPVDDDAALETEKVVSRYPVSESNKLYFQVEVDGAAGQDSVGIIIIDVEDLGVMLYDHAGRQYGNRPDPGYPIKSEASDAASAGTALKVGTKTVRLVTALCEDAFRSGEFFLRFEHHLRVKEDKAKAKAEAAVAASRLPKMAFGNSFGQGLFAAQLFRRRPCEGQTGFVVPIAGRPKTGRNGIIMEELRPLHDPDRAAAVVLFRADYKRDANGQRQVSVVVDPIIGDKLRPHQCLGVKFLYDCITGERMPGYHGAILADEMGLGKTIQTVATIYTCLKQGKRGQPTARKCLVVTPSSLVKNWCNEFDKWLGEGAVKHFAISESTPKGDRIISRFDGEGDVLVISYDQLRKYITRISGLKSVELVVCDEGHRLKNAEVKTTKAVDMLPTRHRIILSGTPIQNDLSEFHAMVGFVNPGILGNRDLFSRVFEEPILSGRDPECPDHLRSLGRDRAHYLSTLTQRFILRRTQSINESYLPPKVDVTVFVRLGEKQEAAYRRLSEVVESASCTPLVLISALRKLCNHLDLFYDAVQLSNQGSVTAPPSAKGGSGNGSGGRRRSRGEDGGAKAAVSAGIPKSVLPKGFRLGSLSADCGSKIHFVSLVLDELRRNGERDKLVIVSNFTQTLDIVAALCKAKQVAYFQLDGSTPIKKRQELVDYFNVPGSQEIVFLLSSKAGGVGLNLIGANRLILFDPDWNPANDAQAMGRVWRDGQKKRVFIYRLLSTGTIEEKIYQRQVSKQGLSANVVDMQEDSKQHFTLEELRSLFRFKAETDCETHDLLSCNSCEAAAVSRASGKYSGGADMQRMQFRKVGSKQKSGPRMDELKAWRHISQVGSFDLDGVTRSVVANAPKLLSFLFADERDNTKKELTGLVAGGQKIRQTKVQVERPIFEGDEDTITCASQTALKEHEGEVDIEVVEDEEEEEEEELYSSSESSSDDE